MLALLSLTTVLLGPDKAVQRYRLDLVINQEVDATAAGQGVVSSEINSSAFVTLTMSDTTGGKIAHVVIDSLTFTATGQMAMQFSQTFADSLKGQWLHGYIVDGKMLGTAKPSVEGNVAMSLVMPVMNALFPGIGAKAANNQAWSDTTRSDVVNDQVTQHSQSVVAWTVTGREGGLLTLTGAGTGTVSVEAPEQQATGQVTSSAAVTTVIGGPSKSAKLTNAQELSVLIAALPDPLPVKVASDATLTELP